jgi:hypothetical protein
LATTLPSLCVMLQNHASSGNPLVYLASPKAHEVNNLQKPNPFSCLMMDWTDEVNFSYDEFAICSIFVAKSALDETWYLNEEVV